MPIPDRYYRYGIPAEKKIYEEREGNIDGFILPAQLIIDQKRSICPWIIERSKPFIIDPMTHVYFSQKCELINKEGNDFRRSYQKLREEYGPPFSSLKSPDDKININSILDETNKAHGEFIESIETIIDFQLSFIQENTDEEIDKYREILGEIDLTMNGSKLAQTEPPDKIILPYVFFDNVTTNEYKINHFIWENTADAYNGDIPIFAMIATKNPNLDWAKIIKDLKGKVNGVILWFSEVDEYTSPASELISLRQACKTLAEEEFNICMHSGSAFSMGLGFDGVNSVGGGITYGERRSDELVAGGPVPQRYFIPQLLQVYPLGESLFIINRIGLDCSNPCCSGLTTDMYQFSEHFFPGDPKTSWGPTSEVKIHYLYRYKEKLTEIWGDGKAKGLERLVNMKSDVELKLPSKYWHHLETWIEAYSKVI